MKGGSRGRMDKRGQEAHGSEPCCGACADGRWRMVAVRQGVSGVGPAELGYLHKQGPRLGRILPMVLRKAPGKPSGGVGVSAFPAWAIGAVAAAVAIFSWSVLP